MKYYRANIAIVVVISLLVISLVGGITLSYSAINYKLSTIGYVAKTTMKQLSFSCKEEALKKISNIPNYTGNSSITLGNGNCSFSVEINATDINLRDVNIDVTFDEYSKHETLRVDVSTSPLTIIW